MKKTNALRILDAAGIPYEVKEYEVDEADLSGVHVAAVLGLEPEMVFKTLVMRDEKNELHVCCIPVKEDLDLKKCAAAHNVKRVEMVHVKELMALTGYIRGGCTPVGMKKPYPVIFDETAILFDEIYLSAGQRGMQMKISPEVLATFLHADFADLTRS